jgi:hypothetical protein
MRSPNGRKVSAIEASWQGSEQNTRPGKLAAELLHLPHEAAGVGRANARRETPVSHFANRTTLSIIPQLCSLISCRPVRERGNQGTALCRFGAQLCGAERGTFTPQPVS